MGNKQSVNEIWPVYVLLQKKKFHWKNSKKTATWKLVPGPFVIAKNEKNEAQTLSEKRNFWSKLLTLDMYKQNYQNLSKLAHRPQIPFYIGFFEN